MVVSFRADSRPVTQKRNNCTTSDDWSFQLHRSVSTPLSDWHVTKRKRETRMADAASTACLLKTALARRLPQVCWQSRRRCRRLTVMLALHVSSDAQAADSAGWRAPGMLRRRGEGGFVPCRSTHSSPLHRWHGCKEKIKICHQISGVLVCIEMTSSNQNTKTINRPPP